jgi:hypothetical protein
VTAPLEKPDHLRPPQEDDSFGAWIAKRKLAAVAGILGALTFLVVSIATTDWQNPDYRISIPGFALTAIVALLSLARREPKGYFVWGVGLALAGLSVVLGWFLMMAVVVAGVVLAVLILNALM